MRLIVFFLVSVISSFTWAHDARPLSVTIVEQTVGLYRVVVRVPPTLEDQDAPSLLWPESCVIRETAPLALALGSVNLIDCGERLGGQVIGLEYPNFNPSITALFRLEDIEGNSQTAVLPPDELSWQVPLKPEWRQLALDYTGLGIEHIWAGLDHLLFIAGFVLLARKKRKIIIAVTGFTVAHSITLALVTLGFIQVPVLLVEALIALSIVFLAAEISRNVSSSFSHRYPATLSFVFGLLHGFGFASVLSEIGLPNNEILTGLLFFNVGVELGQLSFIIALFGLVQLWRVLPLKAWFLFFDDSQWVKAGGYLLGIPAAFWLIERSILALTV